MASNNSSGLKRLFGGTSTRLREVDRVLAGIRRHFKSATSSHAPDSSNRRGSKRQTGDIQLDRQLAFGEVVWNIRTSTRAVVNLADKRKSAPYLIPDVKLSFEDVHRAYRRKVDPTGGLFETIVGVPPNEIKQPALVAPLSRKERLGRLVDKVTLRKCRDRHVNIPSVLLGSSPVPKATSLKSSSVASCYLKILSSAKAKAKPSPTAPYSLRWRSNRRHVQSRDQPLPPKEMQKAAAVLTDDIFDSVEAARGVVAGEEVQFQAPVVKYRRKYRSPETPTPLGVGYFVSELDLGRIYWSR
ncbi:uncharacterized protein FIBRA_00522 [Fibroporia radiculosa]|uniref:Uncharacterized protein n=1 Tax=Fibroporia radiculosa TaxID=599839 RepID=J4G0C9_9APHY|nr:uncharacterized protein FIBRA_00522 [Fibroporia radiculosa]CCL98523.1 predicted protein [Fibroporia radiculosa]